MSYKARGGSSYGNTSRRGNNASRKWTKGKKDDLVFLEGTRDKTRLLGATVKEETHEHYCSHVPSEHVEENEISGSANITNGVVGVGGSLSKKKRTKSTFPERTEN